MDDPATCVDAAVHNGPYGTAFVNGEWYAHFKMPIPLSVAASMSVVGTTIA